MDELFLFFFNTNEVIIAKDIQPAIDIYLQENSAWIEDVVYVYDKDGNIHSLIVSPEFSIFNPMDSMSVIIKKVKITEGFYSNLSLT